MSEESHQLDALVYLSNPNPPKGSQWLRDEAVRKSRLEEEKNAELLAEVANLRGQNAKLKFWLHRAGICTVDGERIEGCDGHPGL